MQIQDGRTHRPFAMLYRDHLVSEEVQQLTPTHRLVWVALATWVGPGSAWHVSMQSIADVAGCSRRTVVRCLAAPCDSYPEGGTLVAAGLVRAERRADYKRTRSHRYTLLDPPSLRAGAGCDRESQRSDTGGTPAVTPESQPGCDTAVTRPDHEDPSPVPTRAGRAEAPRDATEHRPPERAGSATRFGEGLVREAALAVLEYGEHTAKNLETWLEEVEGCSRNAVGVATERAWAELATDALERDDVRTWVRANWRYILEHLDYLEATRHTGDAA